MKCKATIFWVCKITHFKWYCTSEISKIVTNTPISISYIFSKKLRSQHEWLLLKVRHFYL